MRECRVDLLKNMVDAFNDGYQMGLAYGRSLYKTSKKINVEYDGTTHVIEFTRLDNGVLHNYGRSLPF